MLREQLRFLIIGHSCARKLCLIFSAIVLPWFSICCQRPGSKPRFWRVGIAGRDRSLKDHGRKWRFDVWTKGLDVMNSNGESQCLCSGQCARLSLPELK